MSASKLVAVVMNGDDEHQVDITDESFVTTTISGHNISLLESPSGVIMIATDIVGRKGERGNSVLIFSPEAWRKLQTTRPYDISRTYADPSQPLPHVQCTKPGRHDAHRWIRNAGSITIGSGYEDYVWCPGKG